jgi:PAS domain S-box-containing protein
MRPAVRLRRLSARLAGVPLGVKLLGAFALVLLPVLITLVFGFLDRLASRQQSILDDQALTAQAVAVQVDEVFDAAIGVGWAVSIDPLVQTMDPQVLDEHLLALVARHPVYWTIAVFDANGENRGWGNLTEPAEPRLNISRDAHFRRVMATNAPAISNVQQLDRPPSVGLVATVPIRDRDGRTDGVVTVVLRSDQLSDRYEETRFRAGQAIFLVDRTGRLAFDTRAPNLSYADTGVYQDFEPIRSALAGVPGVRADYISPLTNEHRLGAFSQTPKYHWAVGVSMARDVALAPVQEILRQQLVAFGLIVVLSIVIAGVLTRLLTAPIRRLGEATSALAAGDLSRRVAVGANDELGRLGHSFNDMADRLSERQGEILRLRAEAEQRARQLRAVLESLSDAVWVVDAAGRLIDGNQTALRSAGIADRADLGQPAETYFARIQIADAKGQIPPPVEGPLRRTLRGETFSDLELTLRLPDGEERRISASGAPIYDDSGQIVLGVTVTRDITERKLAEEERGRLLERESALFQIAQALLRETELEHVVAASISESSRILGADAVELWLADPVRRELTLFAHRNVSAESVETTSRLSYDAPFFSARAARTRETQVVPDLWSSDAPARSREIAQRDNLRSVIALPLLRRGRLVGVVSHFYRRARTYEAREIDFARTIAGLYAIAIENARLFNEVRDALRLREEFMATAAHELKTPITIIRGWTETLLRLRQQDSLERQALNSINLQGKRITHLVEDLLAVVRLRPAGAALVRERFDLNAVAAETAGRAITEPRFTLRLDQNGPLPVSADRELVDEVILHLLDNAMRYSPSGGLIELITRRSGDEAIVTVRDHGYGISPERQPHVFEPFYETIPSGKPGYLGLVSLGLYLSKQVIDAHGGRIWLTSVLGEGSEFSFSLPIDTQAAT